MSKIEQILGETPHVDPPIPQPLGKQWYRIEATGSTSFRITCDFNMKRVGPLDSFGRLSETVRGVINATFAGDNFYVLNIDYCDIFELEEISARVRDELELRRMVLLPELYPNRKIVAPKRPSLWTRLFRSRSRR